LELKSCRGLGFTMTIVGQSEQWTNSHQHAIHLEPVITQLWMNFNRVSPRQLDRPCRYVSRYNSCPPTIHLLWCTGGCWFTLALPVVGGICDDLLHRIGQSSN
jgi:hypothetical protein